jgi:hypothetical protein
MEQPHIRAHPSKRADLRNTHCRVRRTEKAGQRRTIPSSTLAQHTPNPEGSERVLVVWPRRPAIYHTERHSRAPLAQRPTTDCDWAVALSRVPGQLAENRGYCPGAETSAGFLDQHQRLPQYDKRRYHGEHNNTSAK